MIHSFSFLFTKKLNKYHIKHLFFSNTFFFNLKIKHNYVTFLLKKTKKTFQYHLHLHKLSVKKTLKNKQH